LKIEELLNHEVLKWSILIGYRGSIAHNTYIDPSNEFSSDDKDLHGICIPPMEYYYGLNRFGRQGSKEIKKEEWDIVIYDISKGLKLLTKANLNILILLWMDDDYYIKKTKAGDLLLKNRDLFLTKNIYHSAKGYGISQFKATNKNSFQGYQSQSRKKMFEKYGYDCKSASHAIRILRTACESLKLKTVLTHRPDFEELIDIKTGKWEFQKVTKEIEKLLHQLDESYHQSKLPDDIDIHKVNDLAKEIVKTHYEENNSKKMIKYG